MNEQISHLAPQTPAPAAKRRNSNPQKVIALLSSIMALQMTSYVIILPLFARRFSEFGAGVQALAISAMAYALTSTLFAPFMGALTDRFGRKPLILGSLAAYIAAFCGYLLAPTAGFMIVIRGLAGAFTAGLMPAVTGLAADLAPKDRLAQWIGFVSGGASVGWILGPIAGGVLYDYWGYSTALIVSISMAILTFFVALLAVPESRPAAVRPLAEVKHRERYGQHSNIRVFLVNPRSTLPSSLSTFFTLLFISFAVMFAWAFIEPEFMFYAYNDLGWNSSMLGVAMSTYGVAMMLGVFGLGRLSDRFGRKPIIILGLMLFSAQFIGLAFFRSYILIAAAFLIAGLGNALYDPALTASILDISPMDHRARILGIKSMAGSMGSILGPALVVLVTSSVSTGGIFLIAVGIVLLAIVAGLAIKVEAAPSKKEPDSSVICLQTSSSQPIDEGNLL